MARGQSRRHRDHDQQIGRLQKGRLFLCPHQSWRLSIALCSIRRRPVEPPRSGAKADALRPDALHPPREAEGSQKRRLGVGLGSFFACEKNRTRLLTRSAPCGLTSVSCPAALSVEGMLPQGENNPLSDAARIRSTGTRSAALTMAAHPGDPGALRLWLVALPRDLSPLP